MAEKNEKNISMEQKLKLSQDQTEQLTLKYSAQAKEINQLKLKVRTLTTSSNAIFSMKHDF